MTTETISFRIDSDIYLKIEAIAAEQGLSPGLYLKKRLESETANLVTDIKLMQSDLNEIIEMLRQLKQNLSSSKSSNDSNSSNLEYAILLEMLLILREIAPPMKLSSAQKKVSATGIKPYNSLEK